MTSDARAHQPGTAAQGVAYLSASHATLVVFGFAVHAVASRSLGETDYGRFVVAVSAGTWLKVLTLSLVLPGLAKIVSEDHRRLRAALRAGGRWQLASTALVCVVFIAASPLLAGALGDGALAVLLVLAAVEALLYSVQFLRVHMLLALRRYRGAAACYATYAVCRAGGTVGLMLLGLGAAGAMGGLTAGPLAAGALASALIWRASSRTPSEPYPAMWSRSLSWTAMTLPADVATATLASVDLWIVKGVVADPAAAGLYGAAFAVSRLPELAVQGLLSAMFSRVSGALAVGDRPLARSVSTEAMRLLLIVLAPICLLTLGSARQIMALFFSAPYADAAGLLGTLVVAVSCAAALKLLTILLAAADRPGQKSLLVVGLLPVGVVLSVWLTRRYGPGGAAAASLVTMALGMAVGAVLVYRELGACAPPLTALRCGVAGGAACGLGLLWPVGGLLLVPKLAALGLLYVVLLFLLGEVGAEELRSLWRAVCPAGPGREGAPEQTAP